MLLTQVTLYPIRASFSSVLMAVIASSLLLIVISICLYSDTLMVNAGYKLLSVYLIFTFLRFLIPIELPFSRNIYFPQALSGIISFILHKYINIGILSLSIWNILGIVWLIGSIVKFIRLIRSNIHSRRYIIINGKDITDREQYRETLDRICRECHKPDRFRIIMLDDVSIPMIYGIFTPCILMPSDINLSQEDLYYTLSHEASHYFHHDLLIKLGINILAAVYWWNPAVYALRNRAALLLEMRIDDYVTHKDKSIAASYMACLINILESLSKKASVSPDDVSLAFAKQSTSDIEKRFIMLCNKNKPKIYTLNILLTIFTMGVYMLSYIFIFEAYYIPEKIHINEDESIEFHLTLNEAYLIDNGDCTYDVYLDTAEMPDFYLETIDSLEYYDCGYTIYYLEKGSFK